MKKELALLAGLLMMAGVVAACGGGDSGGSSPADDGGGQAQATNTPDASGRQFVADTGFRPEKNGYKFENFGNQYPNQPGTLTIDEVKQMFGPAAVCENASGSCVPNPGAELWLDAANKSSNGGHCEGFAVTSLRLFKKLDDPTKLGASSAHDLSITGNEALGHYIAYYMASQMVDPASTAALQSRSLTPKEILAALVANMNDGRDPMTMGIYKAGGGGHAIVPYAVEDKGNGLFWVLVYDNNWPDKERHIEIDVNKNTWIYDLASTNPGEPAEPWSGDATTFSLDLTPLSARDGVYVCPWCGAKSVAASGAKGQQKKEVLFSGDGNLTVTDKQGRKLTFTNGVLKSDIPGAGVAQSKLRKSLSEDNPMVLVYLPPDADFTVALTGAGLPAGESGKMKEAVFVLGQGNAVAIDDFDLGDSETDLLTISADSNRVSFKPGGKEKPHIRMVLDSDTGADYLYDITGFDLDANEGIDLFVDEATGKFSLKNTGGTGDPYNIKIVRGDASGSKTFSHSDIPITSGETELFNFGKWDGVDGHAMAVEEDTNSDGTPDATSEETDTE